MVGYFVRDISLPRLGTERFKMLGEAEVDRLATIQLSRDHRGDCRASLLAGAGETLVGCEGEWEGAGYWRDLWG